MSSFGVYVETIRKVMPHPNADKLELAELVGCSYQFIIVKGQFKEGDMVLYYPLDAILPDYILDTIGLKGKLAGKAKNRVKSIKLRGSISQGIVSDTTVLHGVDGKVEEDGRINYAADLGIVKYEEEEHVSGGPNASSRVSTRPDYVRKYDIENAEKYSRVLESMLDDDVWISEKAEGSHLSVSMLPGGEHVICSRSMKVDFVKEGEAKSWYEDGYDNSGLRAVMCRIAGNFPSDKIVTIHGEVVGPGIQQNYYKLPKRVVLLFDIEVDGEPVPANKFLELTRSEERVPTLFIGKLKDYLGTSDPDKICDALKNLSNGKTAIVKDSNLLREGVVIKLLNEERKLHSVGRVFLKQRDPIYLAESKA